MIRDYTNGGDDNNSFNNLTTAVSTIKPNYSPFSPASTFDLRGQMDQLAESNALNAQDLLDNVIGGFAASIGKTKFNLPDLGEGKDGDDDGDPFSMLIKIILGIIQLPVRFGYFFAGLMEGTAALALSVQGLGDSVSLGVTDIFTLVMAIINIIFKYFLCMLSFAITTMGGCFLIHFVTFTLHVVLLIFPLTAYLIKKASGYDISPFIDAGFELVGPVMKWPKAIQLICYTCFGKETQLREVITDFAAIKDIGDMITHDFTKVMPGYMKAATPIAEDALNNLDNAFN